MTITYQLSETEYLQAVNLHQKQGASIIKLLLYILFAAILIVMGTDFSNTRAIVTNILAAFFAIAFYILFVRILSTYQARKIYHKGTSLKQSVTLRISAKGIRWENQGKQLPWNLFTKWRKNGALYLLYTSPRRFNVIPHHAFTDAQRKEFEEYCTRYIG